jgi:cytochrome c5
MVFRREIELMNRVVTILVSAVFLFAALAHAADEHDSALIERIQAVGQLCKAGANCSAIATAAEAGAAAAAGASAGRSGADVVTKHCAMCHGDPGIPGAPRSADEWKLRVDAKGIDGLVASATAGINAMPPKGMCMDCSEGELKAAIQELVK